MKHTSKPTHLEPVDSRFIDVALAAIPAEGASLTAILDTALARFGKSAASERERARFRRSVSDALALAVERKLVDRRSVQLPVENPQPGSIWRFERTYHRTAKTKAPNPKLVAETANTLTEELKMKTTKTTSDRAHKVTERTFADANLKAGQTITKTYKGKSYSVKVIDGGFQYAGKHYDSLSKVGHVISGRTGVNGLLFFGLGKYASKPSSGAKSSKPAAGKPGKPAGKPSAKRSKPKPAGKRTTKKASKEKASK